MKVTDSDSAGNATTPVSFSVRITDDGAPMITGITDIRASTDAGLSTANVSFMTTVSDDVDVASFFTPVFAINGATITSPFDFPLGVTLVTVNADADAAGNRPVDTGFTVTGWTPKHPYSRHFRTTFH